MTDPSSPFVDGTTTTTTAPATQTTEVVAPVTQVATPTPTFVVPDTAKDMIGEGKKYQSVEQALTSLQPAQEHIAKIEAENAEIREQLTRSKTAEEIFESIRTQSATQTETVSAPQIDMSVVEQMVEQKLTATEAQKVAQDNTKSVVDKLTTHYGSKEKAEQVYIEQANALGLGVAGLNNLSATSPKAVFEMLGISGNTQPASVHTTSTVNTDAITAQTQQPAPAKSIMGGATSSQAIDAWRACAEKVKLNN